MKNVKMTLMVIMAIMMLGAISSMAISPTEMSYQGRLTDNVGDPVADASYTVEFRIYDLFSTELWMESHSVNTIDGFFSVNLGTNGSPVDASLFSEHHIRYLGITVGSDPEMIPREQLVTSPYAFYAETVGPTVKLGSSIQNGQLDLYMSGSGDPTVMLDGNEAGLGGAMYVYDENGNVTSWSAPDWGGTGGFFQVQRDVGTPGFTVDGNYNAGEPRVTIYGNSRSIILEPGSTLDDDVVQFPSNAISAPEILDEPGVASARNDGTVSLTSATYQTVISKTITVPAAGYVMAFSHCYFSIGHTTGTNSTAFFGLSDVNTGVPFAQDINVQVPSSAPSGIYQIPGSATGLFSVPSAGDYTFYYLAREVSGAFSVSDIQLNLLYLPTAYGTVAKAADNGNLAQPDDLSIREGGLTDADILAEQQNSREFNSARIQRELDEMQAKLESLQQQMENSNENIK